jgi:hypothetical protein
MRTDRELLELAAKAAGISIEFLKPSGQCFLKNSGAWNPLSLDDDAFRLAITLRLTVNPYSEGVFVSRHESEPVTTERFDEACIFAATRRAIVRAAAEIGAVHEG